MHMVSYQGFVLFFSNVNTHSYVGVNMACHKYLLSINMFMGSSYGLLTWVVLQELGEGHHSEFMVRLSWWLS